MVVTYLAVASSNSFNCFFFLLTLRDICDMVHEHGGQVYLDGANLNAQVCEKQWYLMVKISFTKLSCEDFTGKKPVFFSSNHFPSYLVDNLRNLSPELPERRLT